MSQTVAVNFQMPTDMADFRLPAGVNARLQLLLDKQDRGERLSAAERAEVRHVIGHLKVNGDGLRHLGNPREIFVLSLL